MNTNPIRSDEERRVARFALLCYGWDLNLAARTEVIRLARGWPPAHSKNFPHSYMARIIRQIARGYREVMDY